MKAKRYFGWKTLKLLVPMFVIILAIRMLVLNGFFRSALESLFILSVFVVWIFSGGVPTGPAVVLTLYGLFMIAFVWFRLFPDQPFALRGRGLIRRSPKKSWMPSSKTKERLRQFIRPRSNKPSDKSRSHRGKS